MGDEIYYKLSLLEQKIFRESWLIYWIVKKKKDKDVFVESNNDKFEKVLK